MKNQMTNKALQDWYDATNKLARTFQAKYFPLACNPTSYWIGGHVGDIFAINDMFFSLQRMIQALELNATYQQLFDYDEAEQDAAMNGDEGLQMSFAAYVKHDHKHGKH